MLIFFYGFLISATVLKLYISYIYRFVKNRFFKNTNNFQTILNVGANYRIGRRRREFLFVET